MANDPQNDDLDDIKDPKDNEKEPEDVDKALADLRKQVDEAKLGRAAAEQKAFEASKREFNAKKEVDETNLRLLENAIDVVRGNNAQLKANLAHAMSQGDYATVAEIQEALSSNIAKINELEIGKNKLEQAPKKQPPMPEDRVEALAVQLTPRSAEWVRKHPEYARNDALYAKMVAAHNLVVADGITPDSDEYFKEVEAVLKITPSRARVEDDSYDFGENPFSDAGRGAGGRNAAPAAAPVRGSMSYTNSGSTPKNTDRVRLSAAEVDAAKAAGITEQEYYKNKMALKREGRLN
jgi:hypothetical protein